MIEFFKSLDPRLSAAIVAAIVSIGVATINILITYRKFRVETALIERTNKLALQILSKQDQPFVSINLMCHFFGGHDPNEVRRILLRAGAIRLKDENGLEVWTLYNRLSESSKQKLYLFRAPPVNNPPKSELFGFKENE